MEHSHPTTFLKSGGGHKVEKIMKRVRENRGEEDEHDQSEGTNIQIFTQAVLVLFPICYCVQNY